MLKINKQTITLTKGDDASLRLVPRYKDRTEYVLTEGDSAVFRIKFGHTLVELQCTLNLETNKIVANITPNDTKDFNPGIYRYEAELITSFGFHYTFIADQTFILGQEYEQRITSTSNGNSSAVGGNLPEIDGIVDGEPVVYGDIQPTNPMMDYDELNHLPKLNNITIKGSHDNAYYGIPTKTSDLENDSDFVSDDDYVHTDNNYDDTAKGAVDALGTASTYDVPESGNASNSQVVKGDDTRLTDNRNPNPHTHSKADITDFPTNVSAFNNDSGFITNTVNNLAYYYLKSETYTRTEVEQLIAAIKQGKFEIVAELPASGDANVIYLVPKSTAQTSNSYDEYVYINNAWEKIGDTDIDLSGYVTDDELTTALQSYLTTSAFNTAIASYYTKTETDNLLANKVDKVAGKGLSTNDYDNTAKGIVDGVTSALNDKVDKVQGKGLSTNDYDNTAKGIVDGVTSALADKVDKVNGKGLSTEDYTTAEKSKLGDISDNAKKVASSSTNGHIEIDDVDTTVYDDSAVTTAIDNIEDELSTDYATVEGNPLNFNTLSAQNAKSTILSLEPIQDLHGYDKPWVGGANINLMPAGEAKTYSVNNVTITSDGNGKYTLSGGITSANTNVYFDCEDFVIPDGQTNVVTFLNSRAVSIINGVTFYYYNDSTQVDSWAMSQTNRKTHYSGMSNKPCNRFKIEVLQGEDLTTPMIITPMICLDEYSSIFSPYSNICPISGRTEIGILGCGKNLLDISKGTPTDKAYYQNDKVIITGGTYSNFITPTITIKEVGNYTLSTFVTVTSGTLNYAITKNGTQVAEISATSNEKKSTPLYNLAVNDEIAIKFRSTDNGQGKFSECQLEKGTPSTTYSPYTKSTDLTISLGQTVYGGTLDLENGVLVVDSRYKEFTSTDSETWYKRPNKNIFYTAWTDTAARAPSSTGTEGCFNSNYKCVTKRIDLLDNGECVNSSSDISSRYLSVGARDERYTTTEDFKASLSTPMQIVYPLTTPITINLTPHIIKLLEGVNNISTDGDKITLTYRDGSVATLGDLTSAVDSLDSKIDESKILTDTATGDKYILVVTNGVLSVEQISN